MRWCSARVSIWLVLGSLALGLGGCAGLDSGPLANRDLVGDLAHQPLQTEPWQFGQVPGTAITTGHYHVYTTIKDPLYQQLISRILEACWSHFAALHPDTAVPGPMDCYVFADRNAWELYTRLRAGTNAPIYLQISAGGYCQEGIFAGYDIGREATLSVLSHEAWHQYSWFAFKDRLPSWLEEGLATQSEAVVWDGITPAFAPEKNFRRFQALRSADRENRLWTLQAIVDTHAGKVIKLPPKHIDAYYAQLWGLILFLEHSHYRSHLARILADARAGTLATKLAGTGLTGPEVSAFTEHWNAVAGPLYLTEYINPNVVELEAEYRRFIRNFTASWPPHIPD